MDLDRIVFLSNICRTLSRFHCCSRSLGSWGIENYWEADRLRGLDCFEVYDLLDFYFVKQWNLVGKIGFF